MNALSQESHELAAFIERHPRLVLLTGAGISQASGIPTYRDHQGNWLPGDPIKHQDFLDNRNTRQLYWTRSWYGWPAIREAMPNPAHHALAQLERHGSVQLLITQNVDGLHHRAGSERVVDLHGRVDRVRCLNCDAIHRREEVQAILATNNTWPVKAEQRRLPDGDMEIAWQTTHEINLPVCRLCDGDLMPDVVFFGGSVPSDRVRHCAQAIESADALLVVGSSLMVFSGFRFCRLANTLNKPLAIANPGVTRADELATARFHCDAAPLLKAAVALATTR